MTNGDDGSTTRRVYSLDEHCTVEDLDADELYLATVNGVVPYGVFIDLNDRISGLVHESNLRRSFEVGDELIVSLEEVKENGDLSFDAVDLEDYEVIPLDPQPAITPITEVSANLGNVTIEGRVDQIKQTGGPTIFAVTDGERVLGCAAFEAAGVRAYPEVVRGDIVRVRGVPETRDDGVQLEVEALEILTEDTAREVRERVEGNIQALAEPEPTEFLVEWEPLDALAEDLVALATDLRQMVLESRPVRIRHHADGDGMCAAVPVAIALERFAEQVHVDPAAAQHLVSRAPSRAPFYEMEDATRDLNRALEHRQRHGQHLPMLLMLDNGSTEEDVPGYRNLAHYDIPIAVVDHHHPDEDALGDLLAHHVNPYLVGEDYRVTTGMLCVELARMIDPGLTDDLRHVPAVAGIADRSDANAMRSYLALATEAGYEREDVTRLGEALDYASHWLKFSAGHTIVRDVLGVAASDSERHKHLVQFLSERAREAIADQLDAARPHVESTNLPNGAQLHRLDVDAAAHRFRYPAPGKTTGAIHDEKAGERGDPTITMGYGPDFCVLRSDGVRLDIPRMVDELREELPGGGVHGGGHLVVGSIKFVPGAREDVLDALVEKMGDAELDEDLKSTGPVPEIEGPQTDG